MHEKDMEYAGFWVRVGATIIDTVITVAITLPMLIAVYGWSYFGEEKDGLFAGSADFIISFVLPAAAVILFWLYKQATPGKMVISARVVDAATGNPLSVGQCIGRYFAYIVSILPLGIGLLWVAFDGRKQGWHDKLAGTVVVRSQQRERNPVRHG